MTHKSASRDPPQKGRALCTLSGRDIRATFKHRKKGKENLQQKSSFKEPTISRTFFEQLKTKNTQKQHVLSAWDRLQTLDLHL